MFLFCSLSIDILHLKIPYYCSTILYFCIVILRSITLLVIRGLYKRLTVPSYSLGRPAQDCAGLGVLQKHHKALLCRSWWVRPVHRQASASPGHPGNRKVLGVVLA